MGWGGPLELKPSQAQANYRVEIEPQNGTGRNQDPSEQVLRVIRPWQTDTEQIQYGEDGQAQIAVFKNLTPSAKA
jgi:hypothetical protein